MTTVAGTEYVDTANATVHTFTVPTGVTASMVALFLAGTNGSSPNVITWSTSGSGTFTGVDAQQCTNTYVTVASGSGFVAGDTITATTPTGQDVSIGHWYDDSIASYGPAAAVVATVSQAAQVSGSLTPTNGQRVRVVQVNRNTSANALVSVSSSTGETVTTLNYQNPTTGASVNTLFAEYTATAATARTATVTMSLATNHNTYVAQLLINAVTVTAGFSAKVEVEFDPINHPGVWTDVTADVDAQTGINLKFGRTSEFSAPQVATCDLTLDDSLGKYTALNATSPYYPNIRPRRRIRVSNAAGPRFVGYIKGWPPGFDGVRRVVHITASDRMSLLARRTLRATVDDAILSTNPSWYFPMNDKGSDTSGGLWVAEYNGKQAPAPYFYTGYQSGAHVAGQYGPPTGGWDTPWVNFTPATTSGSQQAGWCAGIGGVNGLPAVLSNSTFTICVAFALAAGAAGGAPCAVYTQQYPNIATWPLVINTTGGASGINAQVPSTNGAGYSTLTSAPVMLGTAPHVVHLVGYGSGSILLYLDGVQVASASDQPFPPNLASGGQAWVGGQPGQAGLNGSDLSAMWGALGHVALWDGTALTAAQVAAQASAILTGGTGEASGTTVARLLTLAGLTSGDMNVAAGQAVMGPYPQAGKTVDAALQDVAATEGGGAVVYVDTDGRVRFNDRTFRNPGTPAMTLDAVLDLDGSNFAPAFDELTLVNSSAVTNNTSGNVSTFTDTASVAEFQSTTDQITAYSRDDSAALNLAQDRVTRQSEPALRVSQLAVDFLTAIGTATLTALQTVTIGSRLRVANIPTTVNNGTTVYFPLGQLDSYVEGWTETIAIDAYSVVFDTSPADTPPRMLWSDPVYGRWQADPGSMTLQASITATATTAQVATNAGSPLLTTNAGDLPMLMVIDTEVINVTAVSGLSSPQTITFTRAANGTLATAHAGGAVVNVYPTADWTL